MVRDGALHANRRRGSSIVWNMPPARPGKKPPKPLPAGKPLDDPDNGLVGGAVGLVFEVPAGAVLYAWHL